MSIWALSTWSGVSRAAIDAFWTAPKSPASVLSFMLRTAPTTSGFPTTIPLRQPVMLYDLDRLLNSTAMSFAPSAVRTLGAGSPPNVMSA